MNDELIGNLIIAGSAAAATYLYFNNEKVINDAVCKAARYTLRQGAQGLRKLSNTIPKPQETKA